MNTQKNRIENQINKKYRRISSQWSKDGRFNK